MPAEALYKLYCVCDALFKAVSTATQHASNPCDFDIPIEAESCVLLRVVFLLGKGIEQLVVT